MAQCQRGGQSLHMIARIWARQSPVENQREKGRAKSYVKTYLWKYYTLTPCLRLLGFHLMQEKLNNYFCWCIWIALGMAFYPQFKWHYKEENYNNLSKMVYSKDIKYMHKEEMKNKSGRVIAPFFLFFKIQSKSLLDWWLSASSTLFTLLSQRAICQHAFEQVSGANLIDFVSECRKREKTRKPLGNSVLCQTCESYTKTFRRSTF